MSNPHISMVLMFAAATFFQGAYLTVFPLAAKAAVKENFVVKVFQSSDKDDVLPPR